MPRLLPSLCIAVLVSVALSLTATALLDPTAPRPAASVRQEAAVSPEDLDLLRREVVDLRAQVDDLEQRLAVARRQPAAPAPAVDQAAPAQAQASPASTAEREVFREQVAQVLTELEEAEEQERRAKEARESNEEYDRIEKTLDARLASLQTSLRLTAKQAGDLGSLLAVQNERNREMTRLWSEGEPKEELDARFQEYRASHRREVVALLGPEQLRTYRRMLRENHLGGRFSFFVGPWEDWSGSR